MEAHPSVTDVQRRRLLDAMAEIVGEDGYAAATVTAICARAGLSRQTFYQRFESREACFLAVLDEAYGQGAAVITQAFNSSATWRDGLREAFATLLFLFESRPELARVWMIESITAGSWALAHRERLVVDLTEAIVDYWEALSTGPLRSDPMVPSTIMAAVLTTIQRHLLTAPDEPLIDLLGSLMGIATGPLLDLAEVAEQIRAGEELARQIVSASHRPARLPRSEISNVPRRLLDPRAHRIRAALFYVASHSGASNREIADAIDINSHAQISRLLSRLTAMGLLTKKIGDPGHANAWSLSAQGETTVRLLTRDMLSTPPNQRLHLETQPQT